MSKLRLSSLGSVAVVAGIALCQISFAAQAPNLIKSAVDEGQLVTVGHSTHPNARSEFDQGVAPSGLPMERMLLVLKRSAERQAALNKFLDELQQPFSPNYHKFLTPEEFGAQFGASDGDIQIVTSWLQSHGFTVASVAAGKGVIEFSGNAGQVESAFHTQIHKFTVNGVDHWANASDQQIPAALASAAFGVSTMHDFRAAPQSWIQNQHVPAPTPEWTTSSGNHYLSPADYATIYNINPLYPTITGAGTTIAVVGRSNINIQDVISFRSLMGLPTNTPNIIVNGTNPGDLGGGEEAEAVLDTSWSGALATGATVDLVVSASTSSTDGVDLSELYIINHNLGNVMTESFGSCEASYTSAQAALLSSNAQQAAAQGISYTVSSGDSGSDGCDNPSSQTSATSAPSVNALASTPYTVAVGGTQFNENGSSQYWSSTNGAYYKSALSYIPEDVWNANCTGSTCGTGSILAGGGGASVFFSKPSWQAGVAGIPSDGARDLPDVSLTSAGHDAYLLCLAGSCSSSTPSFAAIYGTSASAPSFASIIALINQKAGGRQGQLTPRLYALAAGETLSSCNGSSTSSLPAAGCIFNDVTVGTNAVPGEANYNTANEKYPATVGYDLASGLGSVNVTNLVNNWTTTVVTAPAASVSPTSLTFASQTQGTTSPAQTVTLSNGGTAALSITSIAISGSNAASFGSSNTCGSSLAAGNSCSIAVTFAPATTGTLSASLVVTDNSANVPGATQTVALTGTGSSGGTTPTTFTTYLGTYGSGLQTYSGTSVVLPLRAYLPTGASGISTVQVNLNATSSGSGEYSIYAENNGSGSFSLIISNGVSAVPYPALTLTPSGSTVTLSTPITLGTVQITAYRFALAGNELQLDLSVTRSGSFSDQIYILGISGQNYSSPWNVSDGVWSATGGAGAPAVTLSPTSLNFGSESVGASINQTLTVTNSGSAALSVSSAAISGTNAGDFTVTSNSCTSSVAPGANCSIVVTFDPAATGTRTATLSLVDNAANSPQTVTLSGTGSTTSSPTTFTTYLGTYGSGLQTYSGTSVVLPLRAYLPTGASGISTVQVNLNATSSGSGEYSIYAENNGSGSFSLIISNGVSAVPYPALTLTPSGSTVTLSTPITLGTVQITAYRFALAGDELQLDLSVTRSGSFSDQIYILGISGQNYSSPWNVSDGVWGN